MNSAKTCVKPSVASRPLALPIALYPKTDPYYLTVHPIATLVAGLFGGLVIGICIAWLALRHRRSEVITDLPGEGPQIPAGISSGLHVLTSPAGGGGPPHRGA